MSLARAPRLLAIAFSSSAASARRGSPDSLARSAPTRTRAQDVACYGLVGIRGQLRVKPGNTLAEQMFSASTAEADLTTNGGRSRVRTGSGSQMLPGKLHLRRQPRMPPECRVGVPRVGSVAHLRQLRSPQCLGGQSSESTDQCLTRFGGACSGGRNAMTTSEDNAMTTSEDDERVQIYRTTYRID